MKADLQRLGAEHQMHMNTDTTIAQHTLGPQIADFCKRTGIAINTADGFPYNPTRQNMPNVSDADLSELQKEWQLLSDRWDMLTTVERY